MNVSLINCKNSLSSDLFEAIEFIKKSNVEDAFNLLKKLCSSGIKNSCVLLGNMYINDNLPSSMDSFDKSMNHLH